MLFWCSFCTCSLDAFSSLFLPNLCVKLTLPGREIASSLPPQGRIPITIVPIPQIGISLFIQTAELETIISQEPPDLIALPVDDGIHAHECWVAFRDVTGREIGEGGTVGVRRSAA